MDTWSVIGWGGSALVVLSLVQTRILRLRVLNLIGCVILVAFNAVVGVWPMVGMNAVLAIINVVHLWRLLRHRHDEAAYQVLQVNEGDAYLGFVLERHQKDISRFNPGFTVGSSPYAFLVQHGDRTVGVVLAHDAGAGRAQIDLDYVVPKYRDFTPGEFVYRRSDV
ncbi:MAG TPA: hypothetical protein VGL36_16100, partial [Kribbella sp.]